MPWARCLSQIEKREVNVALLPILPFKRKADPIQAVTTKAAMLDAGVAWLVGTLVSLFSTRT